MTPLLEKTALNFSNINDSTPQLIFYNSEHEDSGSAFKSLIAHYLMGIAGMAVCVLGVIGNMLCIAVLSRRTMRQTTTNQYLIALAVSDLLVLLFTVWTNLKDTRLSKQNEMPFVTWKDVPFVPLTYPYAHSLCITFQVASVWLTVAFATDRYFMICHPFKSERCCSTRLARISILIILLLAMVYCVPRFFEHKAFVQDLNLDRYPAFSTSNLTRTEQDGMPATITHNASTSSLLPKLEQPSNAGDMEYMHQLPKVIVWYYVTDFGSSEGFMKSYHLVSWVVLVVCLPLISIAIMNTFLILEVRRSYKRGQQINVVERRRQDTNVMLIGVIVIFFVCQVPAGASHIMWALTKKGSFHFPTFLFNEISNFLVILNSAINIVPYYLFGRKFRKELLHMFCEKCVSQDYLRRLSLHTLANRPVSPLAYQLRHRRSKQENHHHHHEQQQQQDNHCTTVTASLLCNNIILEQIDSYKPPTPRVECIPFLLAAESQLESCRRLSDNMHVMTMKDSGTKTRHCSF